MKPVDLWETKTEERQVDDSAGEDRDMLALRDTLGNMQHYYDQANEHMQKGFQHLRKAAVYMKANGISVGQDYDEIVKIGLGNMNSAKAEFAKKHRRDSWMEVFNRTEFHKWLDKKQRDEFVRDIERNGNIPFTAENIKGHSRTFSSRGANCLRCRLWEKFNLTAARGRQWLGENTREEHEPETQKVMFL